MLPGQPHDLRDADLNARSRLPPSKWDPGTPVTVLALEGDETFAAEAETERVLLPAIAQCEKGQTTPMAVLVSELRRRE